MNKLYELAASDLVSIHGGTGEAGDDSLARDIGQYVGGYFGALIRHPFLCSLPVVGGLYASMCAYRAATE